MSSRQNSAVTGNLTGSIIIGIMGVALILMAATGQLNNYLQPFFRPWVTLTGVALVFLAFWTVFSVQGNSGQEVSDNPMRKSAWLLTLPVLIVFTFAPDPLSASMINSTSLAGNAGASTAPANAERAAKRIGRNPDGTIAYEPLASDTVNEITLEDLTNRFTFGRKSDLDGKTVKMLGFLSETEQGNWQFNRYKIYCCAADAVPYFAQLVDGPSQPSLDSWYEITGTVDASSSDRVPILKVATAEARTQPEIPYL